MLEVTFVPIFSAAVVAVLIGIGWYHPKVFGTAWMRMSNITPEAAEKGKRRMPFMALLGLVAAMLIAWVMNYVGIAFGVFDIVNAAVLGFWCWLGFTAPVLFGSVLWEQKPVRLFLINAGYWLVTFVVMAITLFAL
jgi:hypothetical protein